MECQFCDEPGKHAYRLDHVEHQSEENARCLREMKLANKERDGDFKVMNQRLSNLRYPIWTIFALAILQIGKGLIGPLIETLKIAGL